MVALPLLVELPADFQMPSELAIACCRLGRLLTCSLFSLSPMLRLAAQLAHIEVRITELAVKIPSAAPSQAKDDKETFAHLLQLQERLMLELQSLGKKLDGSNVSLTSHVTLITESSKG